MLPSHIKDNIQSELNREIKQFTSVHGGDINNAGKIILGNNEVLFLKWNENAPDNMFEVEAKGLQLLRSAGTDLFIPEAKLKEKNFLLLEWIPEGGGTKNSAFNFGVELAKLHQKSDTHFGLDHNNFIGKLPQSNSKHSNWPDFFALERIEPQVKMGVESGTLHRNLFRKVESLYKKFGSFFPTEKPALIHGDLWSGNYMFTENGGSSIYDPAVYFGHREIELAMTRLFGGFSANFYEGYNSGYPLNPGFNERVTLYNLYPILVHANLFGGHYARQAEDIINRFT